MTDTNASPATESKRQKASDRLFIDAAGNEVDRIEQATGARYVIPANGKQFDMQLGEAGKPATMMAVFGYHTKLGNVANTVRNDKTNPGTPDDEAESLEEFLASVSEGQWREPTEARGPKYDDAVLADVLANMARERGKEPADYATKLTDKKYRAQVLAAGGVKEAYAKLAAERGLAKPATKDVTDLL